MGQGRILEGKVCLITGAAKGIGKAVAERFVEEGALVYANARADGSLDSWCQEMTRKYDTEVKPLYFDVTDDNQVKQSFLQVKKDHGRLDVLVNNAGKVSYEPMLMVDFDKFRDMIEVNVVSVLKLMQLASRLMVRNNGGSIINISSIVGLNGVEGQVAYSASKGAVISMTKSAAKELVKNNVRVNAVAPGMVATERLMEVYQNKFGDRLEQVGMHRMAEPKEIADACVFLGSDLSTYVTGQVLVVDGLTRF